MGSHGLQAYHVRLEPYLHLKNGCSTYPCNLYCRSVEEHLSFVKEHSETQYLTSLLYELQHTTVYVINVILPTKLYCSTHSFGILPVWSYPSIYVGSRWHHYLSR